jgi:hypothetical protein
MSLLTGLFIVWAVLTGALVLLLIYRYIIEMHEDDQLFLHEGEKRMSDEQAETVVKLRRLQPYIRVLGALSAVMIVVIAGMRLYQDFTIRY